MTMKIDPAAQEKAFSDKIFQNADLWKKAVIAGTKREDKSINIFQWIGNFINTIFSFLFGYKSQSLNHEVNNAARNYIKENGDALGIIKSELDSSQSQKSEDDENFVWEGELLEHGSAPFLNDRNNGQSYFVTLRDKNGKQNTLWGETLRDALEKANAKPGDQIALACPTTQKIQIKVPITDQDGTIVKYEERTSHKKIWSAIALQNSQNDSLNENEEIENAISPK